MDFPHRDGYVYSFRSLELAQGAALFNGLTGFSCTPTIDGETIVYANGRKPFGRTRGRLKVEGTITMYLDPALDYAKAHPHILDEQFPAITASLQDGSRRNKVTLHQVRLMEFPIDLKGDDAIEVALKFTAFDLLLDGVSVVEGGELGTSQAGV